MKGLLLFIPIVLFGVVMGFGHVEADHNHYVKLFKSNPKLEKEFGPINEYGTTDKLSAWFYDMCLKDSNCGS